MHQQVFSVAHGLCFTFLIAALSASSFGQEAKKQGDSSHSSSEILRSAINSLADVKSVEYAVRRIPADPPSQLDSAGGRTTVLAMIGSPARYRAKFQSESTMTANTELAISDGQTVRISANGKLTEFPARAMVDSASADALPTLPAFDPETYRKALESGSAIYAGQDEVEGDLCYVVALPSLFSEDIGSDTHYYWISARTGLPRSKQTYRILHGKTFLTYRWFISDITLNPALPPESFTYHPKPGDSLFTATVPERPKPTSGRVDERVASAIVGTAIPDFDVRDADYRPLSLARIAKGKLTLLTLWATWCAPCVEEFPVFQSILKLHQNEFQIVALATQDSRLNVLSFVKKHPEYNFVFVSDPHLEESNSQISKFFVGEGVPRNAFIDQEGRVLEYEVGSYGGKTAELSEKIERLLAGSKKAR